ncbi:poly(U)-binding-splicing factor PUF60-like [Tropilaelaps mercedesae]|uniref:Poly(U)-binding-splicing factor PUF60-like n=1 Tax=Tropilaelaps mercedesae TaxID=418985 RepID=A0A1V9X6N2_9ACAR|nr:poly(U)-binding-splicing factor PUF60-like [Tropilaelaps mercedesae]
MNVIIVTIRQTNDGEHGVGRFRKIRKLKRRNRSAIFVLASETERYTPDNNRTIFRCFPQGGGSWKLAIMYAMARQLPTPQANLGGNVWQAEKAKKPRLDNKYGLTTDRFRKSHSYCGPNQPRCDPSQHWGPGYRSPTDIIPMSIAAHVAGA